MPAEISALLLDNYAGSKLQAGNYLQYLLSEHTLGDLSILTLPSTRIHANSAYNLLFKKKQMSVIYKLKLRSADKLGPFQHRQSKSKSSITYATV